MMTTMALTRAGTSHLVVSVEQDSVLTACGRTFVKAAVSLSEYEGPAGATCLRCSKAQIIRR